MTLLFDPIRFFAGVFLATVVCTAQVCAQDPALGGPPSKPAQPWQIAGIRAAFGDAREPYVESSSVVQHEALELCAAQGWGAVLDAKEVAAYLPSADFAVRLAAVSALGQMGKEGGRCAKELTGLLQAEWKRREQPDNLLDAVNVALGRLGAAGAPIGRELVPLLAGEDHDGRFAAVNVLRNIGLPSAVSSAEVIRLLKDGRGEVRDAAAMSLDAMGEAGAEDFADELAPLLTDNDSSARAAAAYGMGEMGSKGKPFAKPVAALLHDPDRIVRECAAAGLAKMGGQNAEFAALLADRDPAPRGLALRAVERMGKERADLVPQIGALLKDDSGYIRFLAALALGQIGEASAPFAGDLAQMLQDSDSTARGQAADSLGWIGKSGNPFAPQVATLLKSDDQIVRNSACRALGCMGPAGAPFAKEIAMSLDADSYARACAAGALGQLAKDGALAPSELAALLQAPGVRTRAGAIHAIRTMGSGGLVLAGALTDRLRVEVNKEVRIAALKTLGGLGPAATAFAPELAALFTDKDPGVRQAAAAALALLDGGQSSPDTRFIVLLGDEDRAVRNAAATALDQWGNAAGDLELQAALLAAVDAAPAAGIPELRAHLRLWAGGNAAMQRCVTWLGKPGFEPMPEEGLPAGEMREVLGMFAELWDLTEGKTALHTELAGRIVRVAKKITGSRDVETVKMLEGLAVKLKDGPGDEAARTAVESALHGTCAR